MKTAEAKSSHSTAQQQQHSATPFFQPEASKEAFFDGKQNPAPTIQAKLKIGAPDDHYEKEADATADKVVQRLAQPAAEQKNGATSPVTTDALAPAIHRLPSVVQRKCATCKQEDKLQKKEDEEKPVQEKIQRKPIFDSAAEPPEEGGAGPLQRKPESSAWASIQLKCAGCAQEDKLQKKEEEEQPVQEKIQRKPIFDSATEPPDEGVADGGAIQRQESDSGPASAPDGLSAQLHSSKGSGSPLPDDTRGEMEGAFGADFSNVRVHTGSGAEQMSQSVQAQAFTHGSDIYFNSGKYDTGSTEGKKLLAHELTHTVQQGAVIRPKLDIAKGNTPQIQRGALEWIKGKIMSGLNWAAERLIPGYSLLNVILGKNLITDEPVERSGVNIVRAYMRLIPVIGSILLSELEETETLPQAGAWTEQQVAKFGINFNDIAKRLTTMWDEMSVWRGMDYNVDIFKRYIGPVLGKFLAFSSVMQQKMKELRLEGALRLVGATELLTALKNDPAGFKRVVDNPGLILSNFMTALKQGFNKFKDNFGTHFKNALFGWLFGKAAEMGVQMPKDFSIAGLFQLVAQLLGLTFNQIKTLVIQKLGPTGQKVFEAIEQGVAIVQRVITEGPIALWEMVKEFLSNLKEMLFSQITQLVTTEIIKSAVTKLVSMLNPAGAIVQLAMTLYRVIKFFIDNWQTIKDIATGIINSITKVALGQLGEAANFIEGVMAKGMKLIISFLARIFGLSGIADKVKGLIKKISGPVMKARDKVVSWLVEKGKALFNKVFGKGGKDKKDDKDKKGSLAPVEQEIKTLGAEKKKDGEITEAEAKQIAGKVKTDQGALVGSISVKDGGDSWDFEYVQRATFEFPKTQGPNIDTKTRAIELKNAIVSETSAHPIAANSLVVAVGVSKSNKVYTTLNTLAGKLFAQTLQTLISEKEIFAGTYGGDKHAEENLNIGVKRRGDELNKIDVSNPICSDCQRQIVEAYGLITSTPFSGRRSRSRIKREAKNLQLSLLEWMENKK